MSDLKSSVLFLLAIFCTKPCLSQELSIHQVRSLFEEAAVDEMVCNDLLNTLDPINVSDPLLYGYKGAGFMISAKYPFNPFKKLSRFNKGKRILEEAISAAGENVELRFLRLAIQNNTPAFLRYDDDIQKDKAFLKKALAGLTDAYLITQINAQLKEEKNAAD